MLHFALKMNFCPPLTIKAPASTPTFAFFKHRNDMVRNNVSNGQSLVVCRMYSKERMVRRGWPARRKDIAILQMSDTGFSQKERRPEAGTNSTVKQAHLGLVHLTLTYLPILLFFYHQHFKHIFLVVKKYSFKTMQNL